MESAFKQKGTELLKLEKYTEAIDKYTEALNIMNERINRNEINTEKDMFQLIEKLKLPCLKNISFCYLRLNNWADCAITCDLVLEIDQECAKTWYRKAYSLLEMRQFVEARAALDRAEELSPNTNEIKVLRKRLEEKASTQHLPQQVGKGLSQQSQPRVQSVGVVGFIFSKVVAIIIWVTSVFLGGWRIFLALLRLVTSPIRGVLSVFRNLFQKGRGLLESVIHTCVGPFNLLSVKYLHRDLPLYLRLSGQPKSAPTTNQGL